MQGVSAPKRDKSTGLAKKQCRVAMESVHALAEVIRQCDSRQTIGRNQSVLLQSQFDVSVSPLTV